VNKIRQKAWEEKSQTDVSRCGQSRPHAAQHCHLARLAWGGPHTWMWPKLLGSQMTGPLNSAGHTWPCHQAASAASSTP
jgi:hypothetical protein